METNKPIDFIETPDVLNDSDMQVVLGGACNCKRVEAGAGGFACGSHTSKEEDDI